MPSVRVLVVKSSLLSDWFCFSTIFVAFVIATTAATSKFCFFWCLESCVRTFAGSWLQMIGFTRGVLSPSMFAGLRYWSTFAWVFPSVVFEETVHNVSQFLIHRAPSVLTQIEILSYILKSTSAIWFFVSRLAGFRQFVDLCIEKSNWFSVSISLLQFAFFVVEILVCEVDGLAELIY